MNVNMGGLSLDGDENEGLSFEVGEEAAAVNDFHLCLMGHFLTDRPIRVMIMKERMASIWRPVKGAVIKETSPGLFLFQFFHKDMDSVEKCGHWFFDNYLLILGRTPVGVAIQNILLYHVESWVQAHKTQGWGVALRAKQRWQGGSLGAG